MRSLHRAYYLCNISLIVILLIAGCGGGRSRRPPVDHQIRREPAAAPVPSSVPRLKEPTIRIGLKTDIRSTTISTEDGRIHFTDGSRIHTKKSPVLAGMSFLAEAPLQYFVQIGSYSTRENAEQARRNAKSSHPSRIFENVDLGRFQLQLGPFPTAERAQQVVEETKTRGFPGAFYVSDTPTGDRLPELVLRDEVGEVLLRTHRPVYLWSGKEVIRADGNPYRGYLIVFVNYGARLTVVNKLNMEDYLKGFVPNEIGPASNGNYEALKAQAVAARTYAMKNLKQFDDEGYDICATPRCQVYSGFKTEHFLTSQAVDDTAGEVLEYGGEPINALYTSTCGGKTENAEYMFEGWNYPYLKSVSCYPEEEKITRKSVALRGRPESWHGAWLSLKANMQSTGNPEQPATKQEIEFLVPSVLNALGKTSCGSVPLKTNQWAEFSDLLVSSLCWQKKRDSLLDTKDYQYFVNRLQLRTAITPEVQSFLFLVHEAIIHSPQEESVFDPYSAIKRKELWHTLYNVLKHYHQVNTTDGIVREISANDVQVVNDLGVHSFSLRSDFYLYQKLGDHITPHSQVNCAPGDKVEYLLQDQQIRLLVCEVDRAGISTDRSSKVTFWRETFTPEDLGKKVARYLDIGDILDVQPVSYGVSHRIFEIKLTGSRGSGNLRGIRVRWALGLKDNWFTIERTFDRSGKVREFIFTGRGWGHGVGMCQVGAMGFAKLGKDYRSILKHYYTGVELRRVY